MPSFTSLVGKRVEVNYRAGDIHLCFTARLVRDSGKEIHLEDRFTQSGRQNTVRIAIPYSAILRLREVLARPDTMSAA